MIKIIGYFFSILDKISTYLYERKLKNEGYDEAVKDALVEAKRIELVIDRASRKHDFNERMRQARNDLREQLMRIRKP